MAASGREAACSHVYRKFPTLKGVRPTVQQTGANRVYTFQKRVLTGEAGPALRQVVRVTVDGDGRILKVVASR